MTAIMTALNRKRLVLCTALLLALIGIAAWFGMVRQEDPAFPYRNALLQVPYPGAEPAQVERLVLEPLEEEIAQIPEVDRVEGLARTGLARVIVRLHEYVYDTDAVWDRVRVAIDRAEAQFPEGTQPTFFDDRLVDTIAVVYAVSGNDDPLVLSDAAKRLRNRLLGFPGLAQVELFGDPGQQVTVAFDDSQAVRLGLSAASLQRQLERRNTAQAGGSLALAGHTSPVEPATQFRSLDELRETPVQVAGGWVPLAAVADVYRSPASPATQRAWIDGRLTVTVGVVLPRDSQNAVKLGADLRAFVDEIRPEFAPLQIDEMFFQPDEVEKRLDELGRSLLMGICIVILCLLLTIGIRLGMVVAMIVPLVTLSALAVYAVGGGILHQIAIAGLVISIGMLVDNAIVMVENIQHHLDNGLPPREAGNRSVRELVAPLGAATATTLAAFLPMLISKGNTADFTRMIPMMIMLSLILSYIYAVFVTPTLARLLLRARHDKRPDRINFSGLGQRLGQVAVGQPWVVIAGAVLLVVMAIFGMRFVEQSFFPSTNRNQLVIDIDLGEGAHLSATQEAALKLSRALLARDEVTGVYTFIGSSGPAFYYNLVQNPRSPHLGRIAIITETAEQLPGLMAFVRELASAELSSIQVVPRRLGQGPPIAAPIEFDVFAQDAATLRAALDEVTAITRSHPGTVDVRHNLGPGTPKLSIEIDDAAASRYGLSRADVAAAVQSRLDGLSAGAYRYAEDPIPIKIRSSLGDGLPADALDTIALFTDDGQVIPLREVARIDSTWSDAVIMREKLQRVATVFSQLAPGYSYGDVGPELAEQVAAHRFAPGVQVTQTGEAESSGEANENLFSVLPIGVTLLLFVLLLQFNSFRRVAIILITVPLAMIGVVPGLALSGSPFGFTALLGVIALIGIVVNNAIVLIDVLDQELVAGKSLSAAIVAAVERRTRPIILTTITTIAGLLPLTITDSTLWPPMAWSIIAGLIASTVLTLVVVPALCKLSRLDCNHEAVA